MTLISGHGFPASVAARPRSFALALGLSLLAGTGIFWATHTTDRPHSFVLTMDSQNDPNAIYFSAWNSGPIIADHDASDGRTVVYRRNFEWVDGCTWEAVETLKPVDDHYGYDYVERFVSCPAGQMPSGMPTPRNGIVSVTRVEQVLTPTPQVATILWLE